jgi:hypothetical protein
MNYLHLEIIIPAHPSLVWTGPTFLSPSKTNLSLGDDDKMIAQLICIIFQKSSNDFYFLGRSFILKTEKNDASMRTMLSVYFFSEVLVIGDENPIFNKCLLNDIAIFHATGFIIHRKDCVLAVEQPARYSWPGAFIYEKTHLENLNGKRHEDIVFYQLGGKEQAGLDIFSS